MKKFLFVVLLVGLGVYWQNISNNANPAEIQNPVYVQSRVVLEVQELSRKFEYVFVGEMVSQEDCDDRSKRYLDNLFEKCESCDLKQIECHSDIEKRYSRLFQGHSTYTTYLSLERGNRYERNGRMVIWGLTAAEAELACKKIKDKVKEKYSGTVRCVAGRVS